MKISSEQIQQMLQTRAVKGAGKVQKTAPVDAVAKVDGAALSVAGQDITKALSLISKTADVRADKVAALKERIAAGTYEVGGADIVGSLFGPFTGDR
ncbi:flagellar biosynthesis anti-sigma factor FlgM [bacterium]|nr:flagellar biosynthesis anti-sigma factor FlgM [bacterium]